MSPSMRCLHEELADKAEHSVIIGYGTTMLMELICSCLTKMTPTENCELTITSTVNSNTPVQDCHLVINVVLLSCDAIEPMWRMTDATLLEAAQKLKDLGTRLFKDAEYELAFERFRNSAKFITPLKYLDEDSAYKTKADSLRIQVYLNLSACHIKYLNHHAAISNCSQVLEVDATNVKALYRRAQSYRQVKEYQNAVIDLEQALVQEPENTAVKKLLNVTQVNLAHSNEQLSQGMKKMFFA